MTSSARMSPGQAPPLWGVAALEVEREARRERQRQYASKRPGFVASNHYYYEQVRRLLRFVVEPGKRILEVRCLDGHLLNALEPSYGLGIEITEEMVGVARRQYPHLDFLCADPEQAPVEGKFDYILVSNLFDVVDVLALLRRLTPLCEPHTRVLIYSFNPLWEPVMEWGSASGMRTPFQEPNWLSVPDLIGFLNLSGFSPIRVHRNVLVPKNIPGLAWLGNRFLAHLPGFRRLCLVELLVARPQPVQVGEGRVSVSVVIPCRNERDNVEPAVQRIPRMGSETEIIFCDDHSTDGTAEEVRRMQSAYPDKNIRLVTGPGICKAENVWTGFRAARGDILMILDGDLTTMPEELPYFYKALTERRAEFANGSRLIYPMQKLAMKSANFLGNKLFSLAFSYLLDRRVKDTLCGTKVLWQRDWKRLERLLGSWGVRDLWGDYELLFGAARLQLAIEDVPVHYQERIYGVTKMTRVFANGLRMLRMCWAAWRKLKGGY